jgi:hypothetical protein
LVTRKPHLHPVNLYASRSHPGSWHWCRPQYGKTTDSSFRSNTPDLGCVSAHRSHPRTAHPTHLLHVSLPPRVLGIFAQLPERERARGNNDLMGWRRGTGVLTVRHALGVPPLKALCHRTPRRGIKAFAWPRNMERQSPAPFYHARMHPAIGHGLGVHVIRSRPGNRL